MNHRPRNRSNPRISVVIPALNEARNLEVLLPQLSSDYEIVLVDGNSRDNTVEVARRIVPDVRVVAQTRRGKGNALVCGFLAATGDIIVAFDADCSADPKEIPAFVAALVAGADFAKGSRYCEGGGSADLTVLRRWGNVGLNTLCNLTLSTDYTDLCYGYNAFWADVLPALELPSPDLPARADGKRIWGDGFEIETLVTTRVAQAALRVTEVPSFELLRVHGESNLNAVSDGLRVLRTILTERRRAGRAGRIGQSPATQPSPLEATEVPTRFDWERTVLEFPSVGERSARSTSRSAGFARRTHEADSFMSRSVND